MSTYRDAKKGDTVTPKHGGPFTVSSTLHCRDGRVVINGTTPNGTPTATVDNADTELKVK